MLRLNVVGAILVRGNKILCAQRGAGKFDYVSYKYEFPGGKIEPGESPEEALHRELQEEMKINISIDDMHYFDEIEHEYPDFIIHMKTFICPLGNEKIVLTEHKNIKWLLPGELGGVDWAPADFPIVNELIERGNIN
ncbi:MAG: (deoxy)nucleoside triphosphate pyrophosphohydrolase [Eubacteriaceae bacterium]|jgi:8-oxo-dGTP diphosphatase|nr:(deoxy)nucleoside triphosphate pyrophosphohydrolase [Eubacteriaceae bacterium]